MFTVITHERVKLWDAEFELSAEDMHLQEFPEDRIISVRKSTVSEVMAEEYGQDWQLENYKGSRVRHVFELVNSYRTDGKDVMVLENTQSKDCYGYDDAVTISNYRHLYEAWSDLDGLFTSTYSNVDTIGLVLDDEAPEDLIETLEALADYLILDESLWSEVEQELIQEHWDNYGRHDVIGAVAEALDVDALDLTDHALEVIESLVWDGVLDYGDGGGYPSMVDPSYVDFGDEAVAEYVRDHKDTVIDLGEETRLIDVNKGVGPDNWHTVRKTLDLTGLVAE